MTSKILKKSYLICLLGSFFYIYECLQNASMSTYTPYLLHNLSLSALQISILGSAYFYAYLLMQIPSGMLCDKFGPKWVAVFGLLLMAFGLVFFSQTSNFIIILLARLMMGLGAACAFITAMQWIHIYFDKKLYAFAAGCINSLGYSGVAIGIVPLGIYLHKMGLQKVLWLNAMIGFLIIVIYIFFPNTKQTSTQTTNKFKGPFSIKDCLKLLTNKYLLINATYCLLMVGSILTFSTLWCVQYLTTHNHLTHIQATSMVSLIYFGVVIGSPIYGILASLGHSVNKYLIINAYFCAAIMMVLFCFHTVPFFIMQLICLLIGVCQSCHILSFITIKSLSSPYKAAMIAFINLFIIAGIASIQLFTGIIQTFLENYLHLWSLSHASLLAYTLLLLPLLQLIAGLIMQNIKSIDNKSLKNAP